MGVVWLWPSAMAIVDYYHYGDDDLLYLIRPSSIYLILIFHYVNQ